MNLEDNPQNLIYKEKTKKILRILAGLGVIILALKHSLSVFVLEPRQEYSFYVLTGILFAVVLILILLRKSTLRLFQNLDILVPLGLYLTADELINLITITPTTFNFINSNGFDFSFLSVGIWTITTVIFIWTLQIFTGVVFIGWTTKAIMQLRSKSKIDLLDALSGVKDWFGKILILLAIFKFVPIILFMPIFFSGMASFATGIFIFFIFGFSVAYNLSTYAILLFVLAEKDSLLDSVRKGVKASLGNIPKLAVPLLFQMLVLGMLFVFSVNYTVNKIEYVDKFEEKTTSEFGSPRNLTTSTTNTTNQTTTEQHNTNWGANAVWIGSYNDSSKWHKEVLEGVKAKPLPVVDFKVALLLLLLSIVIKIEVVRQLFGWQNKKYIEIGGRIFESQTVDRLKDAEYASFSPASVVLLIGLCLYFLPIEATFTKFTTSETITENKSITTKTTNNTEVKGLPEFDFPKVILGEDNFEKREIFLNEKVEKDSTKAKDDTLAEFVMEGQKPEKKVRREDKDEYKYNRIIGLYADEIDDEAGNDILVAGDRKAFILDEKGEVKREIDYRLGRYVSGGVEQEYNLPFMKIADINNDGKPELLGRGVNICLALDLNGNIVWKYKGIGKGKNIDVDTFAVGDIDNDGEKEILVGSNDYLTAFSQDNTELWNVEDEEYTLYDIDVADFNGDGRNEILVDESIRDSKGQKIKDLKRPIYVNGALTQKGEKSAILYFDDHKLGLFDSEENLLALYKAPHSEVTFQEENDSKSDGMSVIRADAVYLDFEGSGQKHLAVLGWGVEKEFDETLRFLYIYNPEGELVYFETMQAYYGEMTVLKNKNGTENLLVTDDEKLNSYSIK